MSNKPKTVEPKMQQEKRLKPLVPRTIRIDVDVWNKAGEILEKEYNLTCSEHLRNCLEQIVEDGK